MDSVKGEEAVQPLDGASRARRSGLILLLRVGPQAGKATTKDRDAYVCSTSTCACKLPVRETRETST